jgi:hypothetical protein
MGGMTNSATTPEGLAPTAYSATNPYAATPRVGAFDRWRWLLAGVIGILGGYLTLSSINGPLLQTLSGFGQFDPEQSGVFIGQTVFAFAVTVFAYLVAPGTLSRRVLASVLYVVLVIAFVAFMVARLYGDLRIGGPVMSFFISTQFAVLFAGALGWLIAAGSRPIAFLTLLLTFIVMPLNTVFALNSLSSGWSQIVQLPLCLVIAVAILLASRPATPRDANGFVAMEEGAEVVEPAAAHEPVVVAEEPKA